MFSFKTSVICFFAVVLLVVSPHLFAVNVDGGQDPSQHPGVVIRPRPLIAPLFIEDGQFSSTLVLGSSAEQDTFADVTLRGVDGTQIAFQRVQFAPHGQQRVEIGALLRSAGSSATTGSVMILPSQDLSGPAIVGQMTMTYRGSSRASYIDEEVAMPGTHSSRVLRAVANPADGSALVAITSLAKTQQRVTVECVFERGPAFSKVIILGAGETLVTEACERQTSHMTDSPTALLNRPVQTVATVGIELTSSVPAGIAAFALAPLGSKDDRFLRAIAFSDPAMTLSPNVVFTGVPVGRANLLPEGNYVPQLALANFSATDAHVQIEYAQTSGNNPSVRIVEQLRVPAGSSQNLKLSGLQGDADLQNSFVIRSDGAAGDLVAKLVSSSESELRQVELLGKDEKDHQNGGNHPWSIDGADEATLILFNHSNAIKLFNVQVSADGAVWEKSYNLESMQTEAISLRGLIRDRVKDEKGRTIPEDSLSGQVAWFTLSYGEGKGRLIQTNRTAAMARNFSCGSVTVLCGSIFVPDITIFNLEDVITFGTIEPEFCTSDDNNICRGTKSGGGNAAYSWSVTDANIAAINGSSTVKSVNLKGMAPGSTPVSHNAQAGHCGSGGSNPAKVQKPTSLKVLSVTVLPNGQGLNFGCGGLANYGVMVDTEYQVLDQDGVAIKSASMTPHETGTSFGGKPIDSNIGPTGFTNSTATTNADGIFHDVPFGACANGAFTSFTATQNITMILPDGSAPAVRSQTFTLTGQAAGHGTLKNSITSPGSGSDISATR